jgi:hypothetical protein
MHFARYLGHGLQATGRFRKMIYCDISASWRVDRGGESIPSYSKGRFIGGASELLAYRQPLFRV